MMQRMAVFIYGAVAYVTFLGVFLYAVGFLGNVGVPKSIDAPREGSLGAALLINLALLGVFALQHSGMARPAFKRWLTRHIPASAERSTYVLLTNACLALLFWQWRPLGGTVWHIESPAARSLVFAAFGVGWALVLVSTFLINHFDLFGLRQVWLHLRGKPYTPLAFKLPLFYRHIRHPLYVGWFIVFWATPTMTLAHLVFAAGASAYILIAIRWEERDLVAAHGHLYAEYRRRVPKFIPRLGGRRWEPDLSAAPTTMTA